MKLSAFAPIALFAGFAVALYFGLSNDPTHIPSVLIDRPVPPFSLQPVKASDTSFSSAEVKGRVSLINVFGSWCSICRLEHPTLMDLAQRKAVTIYGIDWKDAPSEGASWLAANGNPYSRVGNDESGRTAIDLGVTGAPETFVIDKSGHIRFKQIGPITPEVWATTIAPLIKKLESET